jgi:hypothetical protein
MTHIKVAKKTKFTKIRSKKDYDLRSSVRKGTGHLEVIRHLLSNKSKYKDEEKYCPAYWSKEDMLWLANTTLSSNTL